MEVQALELATGFGVAFVATPALAGLARRVGWRDDPRAAPERKLQQLPVPPVGGAAILLAGGLALLASGRAPAPGLAAGLVLAFAVGLVDDLLPRGLRPGPKLAGQAVAGLAFGLAVGSGAAVLPLAFLAVVAQNLVNTWDNADGAACGLAALGLAVEAEAPLPAAACGAALGFLPYNLLVRRGGAPLAYLGDAGSHLLALLLIVGAGEDEAGPLGALGVPAGLAGGALVLVVPFLDLLRLAHVRRRAGSRPWIGDRRHLAHRLQARGLGPLAIAGLLVLLALPAAAGGFLGRPYLGLSASGALFMLAVVLTQDPGAENDPAGRAQGPAGAG